MPSLICCRRRMGVASDDFVIPGAIGALGRLIWLVPMVLTVMWAKFECADSWLFELYSYGVTAVFAASFLVEVLLAVTSARGTLADPKPRRGLHLLLYVYMFMFTLEVGMNALGSYWVFGASSHCIVLAPELVTTMKIVVISLWVHVATVIFSFWLLFDTSHSADIDHNDRQVLAILWKEKLRKFFCCVDVSNEDAQVFTNIGQIAADLFHGADLTGTDIGAAFVVMNEQDNRVWLNEYKNRDWSKYSPVDAKTMADVHYWFRYPLAVYGWLQYTQIHGFGACCSMMCGTKCAHRPYVKGDNCFALEGAAMHQVLGESVEVVLADFSNALFSTPFFIAIDHSKKAVVVSCRGTLSLQDTMIDMEAGPEPLEGVNSDGSVVKGFAHRGMIKAATRIKKELDTEGTIKRLVKPHQSLGTVATEDNYQLVICGHSLGAGTATILSIMLRGTYPNLKCYAFSPPGGLLSSNLVDYSKNYLTAVILERDWISRLSIENFFDLKNRVIKAVSTVNVPKHRLMFFPLCRSCVDMSHFDEERRPTSEGVSLLRNSANNFVKSTTSSSGLIFSIAPSDLLVEDETSEVIVDFNEHPVPHGANRAVKLFPPGNIIHVIQSGEMILEGKIEKQYRGVWKSNNDFNVIIVNNRMFWDHMPDAIEPALKSAAANFASSSSVDAYKD